MSPKITKQDAAPSLVILSAKTPRQIEVWKSGCPARVMAAASFDERKSEKSVAPFVSILDLQFSIRRWNSDGSYFPGKVLGLFCDLAVKLRQRPIKPVQFDQNYFWEGFALIFAECNCAPHLLDLFVGMQFRLRLKPAKNGPKSYFEANHHQRAYIKLATPKCFLPNA